MRWSHIVGQLSVSNKVDINGVTERFTTYARLRGLSVGPIRLRIDYVQKREVHKLLIYQV